MNYRYRNEDEMKDSGVEWIGKIPKAWGVKPVKYLADKNKYYPIGDGDHGSIKPEMYQNEGIPYIRVQNLTWGNKLDFEGMVYISEKVNNDNKKSILRPKDILIAKTGATVGKTAIIPENILEANTTSSVGKVTVNHKEIDYKYVAYYFQSLPFLTQINISAYQKSAQPGFNIDDLIDYKVSLPVTIKEQRVISNFLDKKIAQFDSIISKKEGLIEKLEEAKKSLISEVVTGKVKVVKTSDGYELVERKREEMKDSGVEWLGDIPKEWEVKKIKYISVLRSGDNITAERIEEEGIYPVYGGNGLRGYTNKYTHEGNYILIGRQGALCGNINYAYDKFWASEHAVVVNPILKVEILWLGELLRSMNLNQYSVSAAQPGLSVGMIENLRVPFVSLDEQKIISQFINKKNIEIDFVINKTKEQVEKLKEAKQSLISEAVTGKIEIL
ncbi:restriction endonuclease subunit S [Clostridium sp.]|jgi:type I restriction enzyme S subunit|uniref:restriction endonuclease subunit S n=1 Tax=Clostridium sp. TaxID=1506 RepID=UPI0025C1CA68|nr:restriction endonuclease subunit S [Clostridium sp.]MCI9069743.1 restriction endonuclease subunit S [Clostridium sp.]